MSTADATRFEFNAAALEALAPDLRRQAIRALAEMSGGHARNPLWRFDPLDPGGCGVPHLPQHRWMSHHHAPDGRGVKFRLLPGGNRGGKTTTGDVADIIDLVPDEFVPPHLMAYKRWHGPIDMFLVAVSGRAVERIHLPLFRQWCPKDALVGGSVDKAYNKEFSTLHFKNGSTCAFMTQGMEAEVFQGVPLHIVHFDEEPLHDSGQAIFTECMQRLVDYNGEVRMTFTPLNGMTWVYDKLWLPWAKQQPDGEAATEGFAEVTFNGHSFATYCHAVDQDDNPVIDPEGKAAAMAMATNDEERQARKTGRFVSFAGKIYDDFSRSKHVVPDEECLERFRSPTLQYLVEGLDPGFRHQAGVVWVGLDHDGVWIYPELALQRTIIDEVAKEIQVVRLTLGLRPTVTMADPAIVRTDHQTGMTDQAAYLQAGVPTRLGNNDVRHGINAIRRLLAADNRFHVGAGCDVLIDQFNRARWKKSNRSEDDAPARPVKKDDHLLDALRYAITALPVAEALPESDKRTAAQRRLDEDIARSATASKDDSAFGSMGPGQWD